MSPPRHLSRSSLVKSPATLCQRLYQGFVSHFEQVVFGKVSQRMSQPHHPAAPFLHQDLRHWDRMRMQEIYWKRLLGRRGAGTGVGRDSLPTLPQRGHLWKESRKDGWSERKRSHTHCSSEWGLAGTQQFPSKGC